MEHEDILQRIETIFDEANRLSDDFKSASAVRLVEEAKRLSKRHRLLMPYIRSCFWISNESLSLFDAESGIENAIEMIALLESEERAKAFQPDYDEEHYSYFTYWYTAPAYDFVGLYTAQKNGYNSPLVYGAVEDGIHVSRRTGKLENIDNFMEFAIKMYTAGGDLDMAHRYATICVKHFSQQEEHDRRWVGQDEMGIVYQKRGHINLAVTSFQEALDYAQNYHSIESSQWESSFHLRETLNVAGRIGEFDSIMAGKQISLDPKRYPGIGEKPMMFFDKVRENTIEAVCKGEFATAIKKIAEAERFLLSKDAVENWFDFRLQRIAANILAVRATSDGRNDEETQISGPSLGTLVEELLARAHKANQWYAISAVEAMMQEGFPVCPLGIAYPVDIGPYAPADARKLVFKAAESLETKTLETPDEKPSVSPEMPEDSKSPKTADEIEEDASELFREYLGIFDELIDFKTRKYAVEAEEKPFDEEERYKTWTLEHLEKAYRDIETKVEKPIDAVLILHSLGQFEFPYFIKTPEDFLAFWNRAHSLYQCFPENGRLCSSCAMTGMHLRLYAGSIELDPDEIKLPSENYLMELASKAFDLRPDRYGTACLAGELHYRFGKPKEAQRFFARACQLRRTGDEAVFYLTHIYKESGRYRDALAVYDLYIRAGGRKPGLLYQAIEHAIKCDAFPEVVLYIEAFRATNEDSISTNYYDAWAKANLKRYEEATAQMDVLTARLAENDPPIDHVLELSLMRSWVTAESGKPDWKEPLKDIFGEIRAFTWIENSYELTGFVWTHIAKLPLDDSLRISFEDFMFKRGRIPGEYFFPEDETGENGRELNVYESIVRQPLRPEEPAYDGWYQFRDDMPYYLIEWRAFAENEQEAEKLIKASQSRSYSLPCEILETQLLGTTTGQPKTIWAGERKFEE